MKAGVLLAGIAALALGCGGGQAQAPAEDSFVPFDSSFDQFHSWQAFHSSASGTGDSVHAAGPRTEYLNHPPAHGSSVFPVGTIIVKELEVGAVADRQVFCMVKRGGGFNPGEAEGWEWCELQNRADGGAHMLWGNVGPPIGEAYAADPNSSCNTCHTKASRTNDDVLSSALQLSGF